MLDVAEVINLLKEKPQLLAVSLSYVFFLWFLFISIFGSKKYTKPSVLLAVVWGFYCCCFIFKLFDPLSFKEMLSVLILIDSVTALILLTNQFISRFSVKIAATLAFAVLCHSMILLYKITTLSEVKMLTMGFYDYYDELIATVGILQLLVSYDGIAGSVQRFTGSLKLLQILLLRSYVMRVCRVKNYILHLTRKNKGEKTCGRN